MFIRPAGPEVRPADREPGHPLLRGLLARAAGAGAASDWAGGDGEAAPAAVRAEGTEAGGMAAELAQLAGLAREGLLTPEEFTTAKSRLLRG